MKKQTTKQENINSSELELWAKYKKAVLFYNKTREIECDIEYRKNQEKCRKAKELADKNFETKKRLLTNKYYRELEQYYQLPFFIRWFKEKPEDGSLNLVQPIIWASTPMFGSIWIEPTYEGFLSWQLTGKVTDYE